MSLNFSVGPYPDLQVCLSHDWGIPVTFCRLLNLVQALHLQLLPSDCNFDLHHRQGTILTTTYHSTPFFSFLRHQQSVPFILLTMSDYGGEDDFGDQIGGGEG